MSQYDKYQRLQMHAQAQAYTNQIAGLQNMSAHGLSSLGNNIASSAEYVRIIQQSAQQATKPKEKSMFKEVTTDIKSFILEHRGVIYFVVVALIVDHFFFKGAFKARLQAMADKMVSKVEEKIK